MSLDTRYDNRSLSSLQSHQSVQNMRGVRRPIFQSSTDMVEPPPSGLITSATAPGRFSETTAI